MQFNWEELEADVISKSLQVFTLWKREGVDYSPDDRRTCLMMYAFFVKEPNLKTIQSLIAFGNDVKQ